MGNTLMSSGKQNPQMLTTNDLKGVYWLIHVLFNVEVTLSLKCLPVQTAQMIIPVPMWFTD